DEAPFAGDPKGGRAPDRNDWRHHATPFSRTSIPLVIALMSESFPAEDLRIGPHVTLLGGLRSGKYPHGNSLLVEGLEESLIIDPSLSLSARASLPRIDRVINSHCHEDHIAGNYLFPSAPWLVHELDLLGLRSLDGMMTIYGYP